MPVTPEPWLDKRELARHYACGVRSIERRMVEGMPYALIFGRIKFQVSSTDVWLEGNGYLERKAESSRSLDQHEMGPQRWHARPPDTRSSPHASEEA